jgi:hypothetical protein
MADAEDTARRAAVEEYKRLVQAERDPSNPFVSRGFVDPDPSTTHDPRPLLTAVRAVAGAWDPVAVGPIYATADGVIHVGLTAATKPDLLDIVRGAVPDAEIETFAASRSWSQVLAIHDEVVIGAIEDPSGTILTTAPDETTCTVSVGCTDIDSVAARAIAERHGDAVELKRESGYEEMRRQD